MTNSSFKFSLLKRKNNNMNIPTISRAITYSHDVLNLEVSCHKNQILCKFSGIFSIHTEGGSSTENRMSGGDADNNGVHEEYSNFTQ